MNPIPIHTNSRLVQSVKIRRGGSLLGEFPTRSLIEKIRTGELNERDEFSGDGCHWTRLGLHPQLKSYFSEEAEPSEPPGFRRQLEQMVDLLDDLNTK